MGRFFDFLRGHYRVSVSSEDGAFLLDFLVKNNIPFYETASLEHTMSVRLYPPHFREYRKRRGGSRFAEEHHQRMGLYPIVRRYRARAGLVIGAVLSLSLVILSSRFVWDIRVEGNKRIPTQNILETLEANGLSLGAYIPSLHAEQIEKRAVLALDDLSWISLNLRGTVASVQVRERESDLQPIDVSSPSNLVAAFDGQIESLEVTGGVATVTRGKIVKKGDLLVSGVIDSNAIGYRLVRARGRVDARVTLCYEAFVPYQTEEKVYTGNFWKQKSIKIFSKTIKLFRKDSISADKCDRIEEEHRAILFGRIPLPLFFQEVSFAEYETKPKTRTEKEVLALAYQEIRTMSEIDLADAQILARHTHVSDDGTGIRMTEQVECVIDIAKEIKIGAE